MNPQVLNKRSDEAVGKQVHVHLMVENLKGCFFNFGSADASHFSFPANPEA
jgi:pentose-5-phosphate-3-epimerase